MDGFVVSGDAFTKEQAAEVADTINQGGTLFVPSGESDDGFGSRAQSPDQEGIGGNDNFGSLGGGENQGGGNPSAPEPSGDVGQMDFSNVENS